MKKNLKITFGIGTVALIGIGLVFIFSTQNKVIAPTLSEVIPVAPIIPQKPVVYHTLAFTTTHPLKELGETIGKENVDITLRINRIDGTSLKKETILSVPDDFSNLEGFSPYPQTLSSASNTPKLIVVSQRIQAFGVYENGVLVKWGPVSTGKKSTPTPSKLYFTNWKGKSVTSSIDDTWIMPWYFNLDNFEGVSMHEYALPGYPASHACIRLLKDDAVWLYDWAEQWMLSTDKKSVLASGTPFIIFDTYNYIEKAPWKNLAEDAHAASVSEEELETVFSKYREIIEKKRVERDAVLAGQN